MANRSTGSDSTPSATSDASQRLLQSAPFPQMIRRFVTAVQEAQVEADRHSASSFASMADPRHGVDLGGRRHSLLELGLAPAFLHFRTGEMEARVSIDIRREPPRIAKPLGTSDPSETIDGLGGASATPVDAAVAGKYSYPPADSSSIRFRLTSVPAPAPLQEALAGLTDRDD